MECRRAVYDSAFKLRHQGLQLVVKPSYTCDSYPAALHELAAGSASIPQRAINYSNGPPFLLSKFTNLVKVSENESFQNKNESQIHKIQWLPLNLSLEPPNLACTASSLCLLPLNAARSAVEK